MGGRVVTFVLVLEIVVVEMRMMVLACSAMPYVELIRCAEKEMGGTLASATRTLDKP